MVPRPPDRPPRSISPASGLPVSVVIPAYDRAAMITVALSSVAAQRPRGPAEVIVVDDASPEPVVAVDGARIVRRPTNGGPGAARNTGLAEVTTPLVAFVDVDVTPPPGWLDGLLGHFGDDCAVLVAPRVAGGPAVSVHPGVDTASRPRPRSRTRSAGSTVIRPQLRPSVFGHGPSSVARYERRHSSLDLGDEPARIAAGTRVSYVPAAAVVARTASLRAVGAFDPALRAGEDVDLVWRLVDAGGRARYEPAVVVTHDARPTWRALVAQRISYGASAGPLARRHPGALAPLRVSGWTFGVWALVLFGRPRSAALVAAGTSVALVRKLPGVPAATSLRLALTGHALAGRSLASAVRRAWWPIVSIGALVSRRARIVAGISLVSTIGDGGPGRVIDDAAYGFGLWRGAINARTLAPLVPAIAGWPGRRS